KAQNAAWLYMTGEWPTFIVDHENRQRADNRWENLRPATDQENARNAKLSKRNTSGIKGVMWYRRHSKWVASIRVDRKLLHLGYFPTIEEAAIARRAAELQYFGEFASLRA